MRLHPLQSVNEKPSSLDIYLAVLGDDRAFHITPRPELVYHGAPRRLWVGSEVAGPVLASHETWGSFCVLHIDHGVLIGSRLDGVRRAIVC